MATPDPVATLVPVSSLLEYLGISDPGQAETQRATLCLEAARSTLERFCGREFTTITETRLFDVEVNTAELLIGDFQTLTSVETRRQYDDVYSTLASTAYSARRDAPHRPYRRLRRTDGQMFWQGPDNVRIAGTWGMTLPQDLELPILMECAYLFQTNKAPGGTYIGADGETIEDVRSRNPAFYSVADNWKISVVV